MRFQIRRFLIEIVGQLKKRSLQVHIITIHSHRAVVVCCIAQLLRASARAC
jgi:hypothetical protein